MGIPATHGDTKVGPVRAEKIVRRLYPDAARIRYLNSGRRVALIVVHEGPKLARIVRITDLDDRVSAEGQD